jgi:hypothetical protein
MNRTKTFSIVCLVLLAAVALSPNASADEWNKRTILTVNEPLAVPGKILQPGKYVMKLMESPANRHIVQIYNEDESQLQATLLAIPNQRLQPTGQTSFGFWEMPAGSPKALRSWFYPGDNFGQEFAYPKDIAAQIAKTNNESVPAITSGEGDLASAKVEPMTPQGNVEGEQQAANAQPPSPSPETTPPPQTPPPSTDNSTMAQAQTPPPSTGTTSQSTASAQTGSGGAALPSTASPFPLVGLGGMFALGSAMVVRVVSRRRGRK